MAKPEIARAIVDLDGKQAGEMLNLLKKQAKEFRTELMKAQKAGDFKVSKKIEKDIRENTKAQNRFKKATFELNIEMNKLNGMSFKQLKKAQKDILNQIKGMKKGTKEEIKLYNEKLAVYKKISNEVEKQQKGFKTYSKRVTSFGQNMKNVLRSIVPMLGIGFVIAGFKKLINKNAELSDSFADIRKTTGLTKKEVRELNKEFKYLNTRTPRKELRELAVEAGRLGKKSKKDVLDFVEVANQITVALGDDLGDNAKVATREVGKLTNIYKIGKKYGTDFKQSMLMMGSAINEVSASSQAQAPFLIETLKRLGGIADQADISAQNVIGYGSALDQLGQRQETSATAISKVVINMFKDVDTYAEIAKMSSEDFLHLLETDANEAFLTFLDGLNGNNEGLTVMAQKLDDLKLDGSRAVGVLASLASNTKLVREQQILANKSLEEGTSLTKEYNVKNKTLAGDLQKIGQAISVWFINSTFLGWLGKVFGWMAKLAEVSIEDKLKKERIEVNKLVVQLTDANTKAEDRHKILLKLKEINPKIVDGLNAENIEVEKLSGNLKNYNKELIDRIALEKVNIRLQKNKERLLKISEDIQRAEGDAAQTLLKFNEEIALDTKKTLEEKMQLTKKYLEDNFLLETIYTDQKTGLIHKQYTAEGYAASQLGSTLIYLNSLREEEIELGDVEKEILAERIKLMQILASSVVAPDAPAPPPSATLTTQQIADYYAAVKLEVIKGEKEVRELTEDELKKLAKAREKAAEELKKQLEAEEKFRQELIDGAKSLIDQEEIAYNERLKKAGLFGKKKEKMTKQELDALEVLEINHSKKKKEILEKIRQESIIDLKASFDQETTLRQTKHNEELLALGNDEEAKKQLKEKFRQDELKRQVDFLKKVIAECNNIISAGGIDEAMLSDEEKEALLTKIDELKLKLSELYLEIYGEEGEEKPDIFGMTPEKWEKLNNDIQIAMDIAGQLGEMWSAINQRMTNEENARLRQYENNANKKKIALQKQLDAGLISEEKYNDGIVKLDTYLDNERKKIEIEQAKRARKQAVFQILLGTGMAIMNAANTQPFMPMGLIMMALAAVLGGIQLASLPPVPQYELGNYLDVIGATDKKKYRAKMGEGTGLYDDPTLIPGLGLVAEKQPEIVFSGPDTQKILNAPGLIDAINYTLRAPQFAAGQTQTIEKHTTETITQPLLSDDMVDAMNRFSDTVDKLQSEGIKSKLVWSEFEEFQLDNEEIEESVNMRD